MILKMMLAIFLYKLTILIIRITLKSLLKVLSKKADKQDLKEIENSMQALKEFINE